MEEINCKNFSNGSVYCFKTKDGFLVETTDTFLPRKTLICDYSENTKKASRLDRWMIGVSTMSGCPVGCKFCATGKMENFRKLSCDEIIFQVEEIIKRNKEEFGYSYENKINYTRMGEPFLNIENVKNAIKFIDRKYKNVHHYISTIGLNNSDFSWIKDNITLQISLHSLNEDRRKNLIPISGLMSIEDLGKIRTKSNKKTTVNLTLVDKKDFNINVLYENFSPNNFFIKLSPINENEFSKQNKTGKGVVNGKYN